MLITKPFKLIAILALANAANFALADCYHNWTQQLRIGINISGNANYSGQFSISDATICGGIVCQGSECLVNFYGGGKGPATAKITINDSQGNACNLVIGLPILGNVLNLNNAVCNSNIPNKRITVAPFTRNGPDGAYSTTISSS